MRESQCVDNCQNDEIEESGVCKLLSKCLISQYHDEDGSCLDCPSECGSCSRDELLNESFCTSLKLLITSISILNDKVHIFFDKKLSSSQLGNLEIINPTTLEKLIDREVKFEENDNFITLNFNDTKILEENRVLRINESISTTLKSKDKAHIFTSYPILLNIASISN